MVGKRYKQGTFVLRTGLLSRPFPSCGCTTPSSGCAHENLAIIRHLALSLLNQDTTSKVGIQNKRLQAGWDNDYLLKVIAG